MNKPQALIGGVALLMAGAAAAENAVVIKQPGSPLLIETYTARYQDDSGSYRRRYEARRKALEYERSRRGCLQDQLQ
jgi:TPP-dependent pyruvate/acetoin dehydrogenase alpha subunit